MVIATAMAARTAICVRRYRRFHAIPTTKNPVRTAITWPATVANAMRIALSSVSAPQLLNAVAKASGTTTTPSARIAMGRSCGRRCGAAVEPCSAIWAVMSPTVSGADAYPPEYDFWSGAEGALCSKVACRNRSLRSSRVERRKRLAVNGVQNLVLTPVSGG